jgi:glycosyltransferase involved in cell wall biosynthesis
MTSPNSKPRILVFIGSLCSGGKERRLVEMLTYFKQKNTFEFQVVVTDDNIHYQQFLELNIPYVVIKKIWKKNDPTIFFRFYQVCKNFKPDLIHTWGRIQSLYTLPTVITRKIPLINSQITSAPPILKKWSINGWIDKLNFHYSTIILSNSKAGIASYNPPANKVKLIYNGINMDRFSNLPSTQSIKIKYGICTPYTVVMAASFTNNKDYDTFYKVAKAITSKREDVTFIGVGGYGKDDSTYRNLLQLSANTKRILFPGRITDVEALVNACTVGVLFSNKKVHGEGISNSILEYMCLAKPVLANDAGGTNEIVYNNENGYLVADQSPEEISQLLLSLLDNEEKCQLFGMQSRRIAEQVFSLEKMGQAFEEVYMESLTAKM